jgi:hypothetical protein
VLEELRLGPRALAGRTRDPRQGIAASVEEVFADPSLSTAFAEGFRDASTGAHSEIHRLPGATK